MTTAAAAWAAWISDPSSPLTPLSRMRERARVRERCEVVQRNPALRGVFLCTLRCVPAAPPGPHLPDASRRILTPITASATRIIRGAAIRPRIPARRSGTARHALQRMANALFLAHVHAFAGMCCQRATHETPTHPAAMRVFCLLHQLAIATGGSARSHQRAIPVAPKHLKTAALPPLANNR